MSGYFKLLFAIAILFGLALVLSEAPAAAPPEAPAKVAADVQDVVFLAEARPVLVRLHVRVDDKPVQHAWDGFMKYLFAYLDVNGDGVLDKAEAERAPSVQQIRGGLLVGLGGRRPSLADLDTDKDGKVTLAELSAYYRTKGLLPFQVQIESGAGDPTLAFLGVGGGEPSVAEVRAAIFNLLDTDGDGKLTRKELAAAPKVLLRMDEDEDEMITTRELVPNPKPPAGGMMARMAMRGRGRSGSGPKLVIPVATPGKSPAGLVSALKRRYKPKGKRLPARKLSRKDLGLDEETFRRLDANGDGKLDDRELAGFVKRAPDVEFVVRLGSGEARVEVVRGKAPLTSKVKVRGGLALLDLGKTRVELRGGEEAEYSTGVLGGLIRQQYLALFKAADKDNNGYLDEKEAKASPLYAGAFKAIDRDGDGKVTEKEVMAYLAQYEKIQERAMAGCVSLVLTDSSRGLFDLLDVDRDGRLSVREMRGAVGLLKQLDRSGKGFLTRADLPHSYQLTLRRGQDAGGQLKAVYALYGGGKPAKVKEPTAGPLWFRKMDRNRDGDVSRKEFLFGDELFRKIDTDGDGLISLEEAIKAEALLAGKGLRKER
jgi:Ca2+-binding EF-hand superfamily protein